MMRKDQGLLPLNQRKLIMHDSKLNEHYVVKATLLHVTQLAYKVTQDKEEFNQARLNGEDALANELSAWIPRSQCEETYMTGNIGEEHEFTLPQWLIEEKGLEVG